jgi:uncharacterized protein YdaU (DUF1376 family)
VPGLPENVHSGNLRKSEGDPEAVEGKGDSLRRSDMAKLPWMKFFPADYLLDTQLLTSSTRGVWMDIICHLWRAPTRGSLTLSVEQWSILLRVDEAELSRTFVELQRNGICNIVTGVDRNVTVLSRRLVKEENTRNGAAKRMRAYRDRRNSYAAVTGEKLEARRQKLEAIYQKEEGEEEEEEGSGGKPQTPPVGAHEPYPLETYSVEEIRARWNQISGVKSCRKITGDLEAKINRLRKSHKTPWWDDLFGAVQTSQFLTGQVQRGGQTPFRVALSWAVGPINLSKILAGNYAESSPVPLHVVDPGPYHKKVCL